MKVSIRTAKSPDSKAISRIAADTFPLACLPDASAEQTTRHIRDNFSTAEFRRIIAGDRTVVYVAEHGGEACGFVVLRFASEQAADLEKLYVDPRFHGGGVAARLLDQAVECVRENGCGSINLSVSKSNGLGIAFYHKVGFIIVGETELRVGTENHEDY